MVVYKNCCLLQIGISSEISSEDGNPTDVDVPSLTQGALCQKAMQSGKRKFPPSHPSFSLCVFICRYIYMHIHNCFIFIYFQYYLCKFILNVLIKCSFTESYLANLSLYPGRVEFPFLPANTQVLTFIRLIYALLWMCIKDVSSVVTKIYITFFFFKISAC